MTKSKERLNNFHKQLVENKNNTSKTWQTINHIITKTKHKKTTVESVEYIVLNNKKLIDPAQLQMSSTATLMV